jgi:hypothetical protein
VTPAEVSALRAGDWLQESLTEHHRGRPRWGRPRRVVKVERIWIARGRVVAAVAVAFRGGRLRWTVSAGSRRYRLSTAPTNSELVHWASLAESAPEEA